MLRQYVCHYCTKHISVTISRSLSTRKVVVAGASLAAKSRRYSTAPSTTPSRPTLRCAIIGSGPAGFYAAHRLLQRVPTAQVDMYEALPTPYGLVRFGVAPDHPEVKNCIDTFTKIATSPQFTFIANTPIGSAPNQLPLTTLAQNYHSLLFSYGASEDRTLGLEGESLRNVVSARAFVGWYNGLPEYAGLQPNLQDSEEAVVIGQGNVALDVARILLSPIASLRKTDITEEAIETLNKSRVKRVRVVGRRGPLQAPFTIKEVRELMKLEGVSFSGVDPTLFLTDNLKKLPRQLMRSAQVLQKGSSVEESQARKAWELAFMLSPNRFLPSSSDASSLGAVKFSPTEYTVAGSEIDITDINALRTMRVQPKRNTEDVVLHTGLAFRSVGYKSTAIKGMADLGVPFDDKTGIIPNDLYGRVLSTSLGPGGLTAGHVSGVYCAGWVKRGPTGVIASTMEDAFTSAEVIARDWADGVKFLDGEEQRQGWDGVKSEADRRGIRRVSWADWEVIDKEEKRRGQAVGKEREKCRSVEEMLKILDV